MPERRLTSDELGEKGEKRFAEICADAKLVANSSSRDRAGWDFIVDVPIADQGRLDARPGTKSARIQVKTVWADNERIRIRVSSAELLVKHDGPTFVCVLAVNDDLNFTELRVLHCLDDVLARVLQALRQAEATKCAPNSAWVNLRVGKYASAVPPTGNALRSSLEAVLAEDTEEYLAEKRRQLREVGFGSSRLSIRGNFTGTEDEIIDAFLGKGSIDAEILEAKETRFGIDLPAVDVSTGAGKATFKPPGQKAILKVRGDRGVRYQFPGRIYQLPKEVGIGLSKFKTIFSDDLFELSLVISPREFEAEINVQLVTNGEAMLRARKSAKEWSDVFGMLACSARIGFDFELIRRSVQVFSYKVDLEFGSSAERWREIHTLAEAALVTLRRAGSPNFRFSLNDIWAARGEVAISEALISKPHSITGVNFSTDASIDIPMGVALDFLQLHSYRLGTCTIAYATRFVATGSVDGSEARWASEAAELLSIRRVRGAADFSEFVRSVPCSAGHRVYTGLFQDGLVD